MIKLSINSSVVRKANVYEAQEGNTVENNFVKHNVYYMDTDKFFATYHPYEFNRGTGTDEERARKIAREFNFLLTVPVIVDPKSKTILDGHHLSRAIQIINTETENRIPEILVQEVILPRNMNVGKAVQIFNNNRKGWDLSDYIENYIKEGYVDYIRLKEMADNIGPFFHEDNKYRWRYTSALAGKNQQDKLRDGSYSLSKADYEKQFALGKEIQAFWKAGGSPKVGPWAEPFILAVWNIKYNPLTSKFYDFNRLLEIFTLKGKEIFASSSLSTKVWSDNILEYIIHPEKLKKVENF